MKNLNKTISVLKKGGIVICPTDTVYGFLADASNKKAVEKIYKIKKRPKSKALPVFVSSIKMAREIAEIYERQAKILRKFLPGAYTFVLKRKTKVGPSLLYGQDKKTIALRIPKHTFLQKLLKRVNRPLVQTSVNISTQAPMRNIEEIIEKFGREKRVSLIIDGGNLSKAKPSKIIDLTGKKIVRLR